MPDLLQDLRYGVRSLIKAPAFATAAIVALALGIGATTAIFSVVNAVVLDATALRRAGPAGDALGSQPRKEPRPRAGLAGQFHGLSGAHAGLRRRGGLVAARRSRCATRTRNRSGSTPSRSAATSWPSSACGRPSARAFRQDVFYSRDRLVLMSHRLWESRFSSDAAIVGKTIRLNDDQFTVAGVMPRGFDFPGDTDLWERLNLGPDAAQPRRALHGDRRADCSRAFTLAAAQRELDALTGRLSGGVRGDQSRLAHARDPPARRSRRPLPIGTLRGAGRGGLAAAHRVHQHREPAPGAGGVASAGGRRARRDRRDAPAADPSVPDGKPRARRRRRNPWRRARIRRP